MFSLAIKSNHIKVPVCLNGHHANFHHVAPAGLLQAEVLVLLCASSRNHKILLVKHNNFCHHSFNCSHIRATKHYLVETEDKEEKSKERESFADYSAASKPKVPEPGSALARQSGDDEVQRLLKQLSVALAKKNISFPLNLYNRRPANDKKEVGNDVIW